MSSWMKILLGLGCTTGLWLVASLVGGISAEGNLFGMVAVALFPLWMLVSAIITLAIWLRRNKAD